MPCIEVWEMQAGLQESFLLQEGITILCWVTQTSCEISAYGECQELSLLPWSNNGDSIS